MTKSVETFGKTIEEALQEAINLLGVDRDQVDYVVLEEPSKGLFGKIKNARIRVTVLDKDTPDAVEAVVTTEEVVEAVAEVATVEDEEFLEEEELACEYILSVCEAMGLEVELVTEVNENTISIEVQGDDLGILIGRRGETLDSLQYLVGLVINKNRDKYYKISIDAENYRAKREAALVRLAKKTADRVTKYRRPITLDPMNPNERRIVHSALQGYRGVETYSVGEDPNRKVVIRPVR